MVGRKTEHPIVQYPPILHLCIVFNRRLPYYRLPEHGLSEEVALHDDRTKAGKRLGFMIFIRFFFGQDHLSQDFATRQHRHLIILSSQGAQETFPFS
jgi:hypothetical protein